MLSYAGIVSAAEAVTTAKRDSADEPEMTGEPRAEDELKMTGEPETEDGETDETVTTVAPRRDCGAGGQKNTADVWKDVTEKRVVSQRKI